MPKQTDAESVVREIRRKTRFISENWFGVGSPMTPSTSQSFPNNSSIECNELFEIDGRI